MISVFAALAAGLLGLAIAWRMQRGVTRPVLALREAMANIQASHDFSGSVAVPADGEIGELVAGFNTMLAEVQTRDRALADHLAGLEDTVRERTAAADAANAAKSDFLATMSHEIRTPMNGIMVMAEMLSVGELPKRQRRFAEVIAKSGSSLLSIINDILDFSKIEAGKMELEVTAMDVAEAAEDVCALFWERARSKGLDLAAIIDPATPELVAGDPVRLRQVIGNLVNNAIKFTESGGVLVRVTPAPGGLTIAVQDSGIGIAADKLGAVFGAFSQADQSTTRKYGGTGLGLAISKRLVEAMDGQIGLTSELGRGSTFSLTIPVEVLTPAKPWPDLSAVGPVSVLGFGKATQAALYHYLRAARAKAAAAPLAQPAPSLVLADPGALKVLGCRAGPTACLAEYGDALPGELRRDGLVDLVLVQPLRRRDLRDALEQIASGAPLTETVQATEDNIRALPQFTDARVLVADDSAVNREVAIEALSRLGIACEAVEDGRQALERARQGGLDLILMDGSMPELDGYDATRAIRQWEADTHGARLPIMALTAHVVGSAADAWREAGMDGVLHKPFTLQSLADGLGRFLAPTAAPSVTSRPQVEAAATPPRPTVRPPSFAGDLFDRTVLADLAAMAADGKSDFVERVRKLYRDNAPAALHRIVDAASVQDAAAATTAAHALKSMSLNIGAKAVAELAAQIEREGRDHGRIRAGDAEALHRLLLATLDALSDGAQVARPEDPEEVMAQALTVAAERGEFTLVYQPQIDRDGETVVGVEVLLRWTHPTLGKVSPALFIPIAERRGLMRPITRWVVDRAMADTADMDLTISFNASALEFADPTFADELAFLIAQRGFDPKRLEVEVTETAILSDGEEVRRTMERLHEMGLRIALDDFGVGYSSLSHLRNFPFDKLKIDKSFVDDCCTDMQSATLIHAVVSVGRALGMKVVAEGIENDVQQKFLRAAGVHAFQGFALARPQSLEDLRALISSPEREPKVA